jgi:hypothetical protein
MTNPFVVDFCSNGSRREIDDGKVPDLLSGRMFFTVPGFGKKEVSSGGWTDDMLSA